MKDLNLTKHSQITIKCSCGSSDIDTSESDILKCENCGNEYNNIDDLRDSNPENQKLIDAEIERLTNEGIEEIKEKITDDFFKDLQNTFRGNKYIKVSKK